MVGALFSLIISVRGLRPGLLGILVICGGGGRAGVLGHEVFEEGGVVA